YAANGDHRGNISVITEDGSVQVVGGMETHENSAARLHWAGIGHAMGYGDSNADNGNGNLGQVGESIVVHALGPNGNVVVMGGEGQTTAASIGHGAYYDRGTKFGDIEVIAGNNLYMNAGNSTVTTNGSKIGHGDSWQPGIGDIDGEIRISIGNSAHLGRAIVGHVDTSRGGAPSLTSQGNTYFAVSRNNPYGNGELVTTNQTVFSSAGMGLVGDELRLYMPNSAMNGIATGTYLNESPYTRTPKPGDPSRADEHEAVEHQFSDPFDIGSAQFTPEGDYPFHAVGLYNIYYAGEAPPEVPTVPGGGGAPTGPSLPPVPPVEPPFAFSP